MESGEVVTRTASWAGVEKLEWKKLEWKKLEWKKLERRTRQRPNGRRHVRGHGYGVW